MKMAQNATFFIDPSIKIKERGMMLVEHRRCEKEIISYCNDLAYDGLLRPMKKKSKEALLFSPMLLIDVESKSTLVNKDRFNEKESDGISEWIYANRRLIEEKYKKPIEEVLGVITPFRGQKKLLSSKLARIGVDINKMKIGTVHALQGAEREIIIFSPVYGIGDAATMFFDRDNKPNMLNVAVSRAKDNFIVIGNKEIFNKVANTPSGKLAKYLTLQKDKVPM
jgi:superfamily I DNA and/or RNA helicase